MVNVFRIDVFSHCCDPQASALSNLGIVYNVPLGSRSPFGYNDLVQNCPNSNCHRGLSRLLHFVHLIGPLKWNSSWNVLWKNEALPGWKYCSSGLSRLGRHSRLATKTSALRPEYAGEKLRYKVKFLGGKRE
jgi:hypothetical protein